MIEIESKGCVSCKFYVSTKGTYGMGKCHRFPPLLVGRVVTIKGASMTTPWSHFPEVDYDNFCGEWKSKPKK